MNINSVEPMKNQKHTLEFIKRQAKKLKKQNGITHTKALEMVANELGFVNWKTCLQSFRPDSDSNSDKP
jgi:hypothetical protein